MLVFWYLLSFLTGFAAASLIAYLRGRRKTDTHREDDEFYQILNY